MFSCAWLMVVEVVAKGEGKINGTHTAEEGGPMNEADFSCQLPGVNCLAQKRGLVSGRVHPSRPPRLSKALCAHEVGARGCRFCMSMKFFTGILVSDVMYLYAEC
eukprot:scaffold65903_cov20-Tisochrysis_lutea.AAC.1